MSDDAVLYSTQGDVGIITVNNPPVNALRNAVRAGIKDGIDKFAADPAVKAMISRAIAACRAVGKYVGICGQGPSDHPDFAEWLAQEGIVSMSLNPDTVVETWQRLAKR